MQSSISIHLRKLLGLALLAGLLGVASNAMRQQPLPWNYQPKETRMTEAVESISGSANVLVAESAAAFEQINLEQVFAAVEDGQALIIDARPPLFFQMGHLPGAINLPREQFQMAYLKHPELAHDKQRRLIIYCHSATCEDSKWVAKGLQALDHPKIVIFAEGWQAWQDVGQRVETGP